MKLAAQAQREVLAPQVLQDPQEAPAAQDPLDLQAALAQLVLREAQDVLDPLDPLDLKGTLDQRVQPVAQDLKVFKVVAVWFYL